eukprot:10349215-Alexandrium_andersonii.AAC.1
MSVLARRPHGQPQPDQTGRLPMAETPRNDARSPEALRSPPGETSQRAQCNGRESGATSCCVKGIR